MAGTYPFSDDFNDNTQDTAKWSKAAYHDTDALVTVVETGGQLEITPRSSQTGQRYNGYLSVDTFDFTNRAVQVEVPQVTSGSAVTELLLAVNATNAIGFDAELGLLYFFVITNGVSDFTSVTYSSTDHRFWRLRHSMGDDTFRWETSPDGVVWTQRRSLARSHTITAVNLQLLAGTYESVATPGKAIFDNFSAYAANLYEQLDEEAADDAQYISSPVSPSSAVAEVQLATLGTPDVGDITLRVRHRLH